MDFPEDGIFKSDKVRPESGEFLCVEMFEFFIEKVDFSWRQ